MFRMARHIVGLNGRVAERRLVTVLGGLSLLLGLSLSPVAFTAAADTTRGPNGKSAPTSPPRTTGGPLVGLPTSHVPEQEGGWPTSIVPGVVSAPPGRVIIDGKGFGHGVGMAQDGALYLGKQGRSAGQILQLFYPGTTLGKRGGMVRVPITSIGSLIVTLPAGGKVGGVAIPAGGSVRLIGGNGVVSAVKAASPPPPEPSPTLAPPPSPTNVSAPTSVANAEVNGNVMPFGGRFAVPPPEPIPAPDATVVVPDPPSTTPPVPPPAEPATTVPGVEQSTVPPSVDDPTSTPAEPKTTRVPALVNAPTVGVTPAGGGVSVVGNKRYRGTLVFTAASSGMSVVNEIDVEQYLRGMGEVLSRTWPAASLQSQAIAARTYALREMDNKGQVCPTQKCQVYLGAQAEYPEMDAAVRASAGKVVMYEGKLAATFYSASGGGTIADPAEVFGPGISIPYLRAGTYPIDDPKAWRVELSMVELGRRFGYPGTLFDAVVSERGPSGRAVTVSLIGSKGTKSMTGPAFDKALNLRSTNFSIHVGKSAVVGTMVDTAPATVESTPIGTNPSSSLSDSSGDLSSPLDYQSDLFQASRLPNSETSPTSTPSTTENLVTTVTISTTSPVTTVPTTTALPSTTASPTTASPTTASPTTEVPGTTIATQAASLTPLIPDSSSPVPSWAGWAAMGGIGIGGVWLSLRWAFRPEQR